GNGFKLLVEEGQHVDIGTPLLDADLSAIKAKKYSVITPVIILNKDRFKDVASLKNGSIRAGEEILELAK
ncbi:hypothetical protein Q757_06775, partial [Oenococcus alcoholitolerans]